MPDTQTIWSMTLTALFGGAAWVMRTFAGRVDTHEQQLMATRELLLRDYVPKAELMPRLDRMDAKLDRVLEATRKDPA